MLLFCQLFGAQALRGGLMYLRWLKPTWTRSWSWTSSSLTTWLWTRSTMLSKWWSTANGRSTFSTVHDSAATERWMNECSSQFFLLHSIRTVLNIAPQWHRCDVSIDPREIQHLSHEGVIQRAGCGKHEDGDDRTTEPKKEMSTCLWNKINGLNRWLSLFVFWFYCVARAWI